MSEQQKVQDQAGLCGPKFPRSPQAGRYQDIPARIREMYKQNSFMADFFHIHIDEIRCGSAQVSLDIDRREHGSHRNAVQGGVLTALADSVLWVTGASVGEAVAPLSFSMNFIGGAVPDGTVRVASAIKHHGRTTMVITGEMYDKDDRLLATMLASVVNEGKIGGIPREW